jgi:hypothetical protein
VLQNKDPIPQVGPVFLSKNRNNCKTACVNPKHEIQMTHFQDSQLTEGVLLERHTPAVVVPLVGRERAQCASGVSRLVPYDHQ